MKNQNSGIGMGWCLCWCIVCLVAGLALGSSAMPSSWADIVEDLFSNKFE